MNSGFFAFSVDSHSLSYLSAARCHWLWTLFNFH